MFTIYWRGTADEYEQRGGVRKQQKKRAVLHSELIFQHVSVGVGDKHMKREKKL